MRYIYISKRSALSHCHILSVKLAIFNQEVPEKIRDKRKSAISQLGDTYFMAFTINMSLFLLNVNLRVKIIYIEPLVFFYFRDRNNETKYTASCFIFSFSHATL